MTLYYSLVFLLLVAEMLVFMLLILPMPFQARRKLFTFISESRIVAKMQYGTKITFIFILILFIDSVNRVYRVQFEAAASQSGAAGEAQMAGSARMEVQARKFYAQRNMYLCGFTLFLSLILNRTYVMILEVLRLEAKVRRYEGNKVSDKDAEKLDRAGAPSEIGRLRNDVEKKDKNIEALKKQMAGLQREYGILGDQVGNKDGTPKKDR